MILPQKHIKISESIFGLGAFIIGQINKPKSFDELWADFQKVNNTEDFPSYHDLDNFSLALTFLFIIGAIQEGDRGKIELCN